MNLKTDSDELYEHTLEVLNEEKHEILLDFNDIYSKSELPHPDLDIKTYYEYQHLAKAKTIKFVQFRLNY